MTGPPEVPPWLVHCTSHDFYLFYTLHFHIVQIDLHVKLWRHLLWILPKNIFVASKASPCGGTAAKYGIENHWQAKLAVSHESTCGDTTLPVIHVYTVYGGPVLLLHETMVCAVCLTIMAILTLQMGCMEINRIVYTTGLSLDILKMESWTHMGRTANIIIKDVIHVFASISKIMRILLMGGCNRERCTRHNNVMHHNDAPLEMTLAPILSRQLSDTVWKWTF